MQQLTGLDASFLHMENGRTTGHVAFLAIFDPPTAHGPLALEDVVRLFEERIHLVPYYRRRLVEVPFGINHPYWIEDPDFDLDFHIRHIAVPPPGDDRQLAELVARLHARPLDRARPLWEFYLIEGLSGDRVAQYSKVHHCAVDGVSGMEALTLMLDLVPEPRKVPLPESPWTAEPVPGQLEMFGRGALGLVEHPRRVFRLVRSFQTLARPAGGAPGPRPWLLQSDGRREGEPLSRPAQRAPRVSFNRTITAHRRFAFGTVSLDDAKRVKNVFGYTVNDVVMALCSGALRRWLLDHGELPADPLLAMVPVSVRTAEEKEPFGNRVSGMIVSLATHLADPLARLNAIHEAMRAAKEDHQAIPATLLQDFAHFATPALAARAARWAAAARVADYVDPPFNLVISNVPGPNVPLYGGGARMLATYPVSAIGDGAGLNITVMSYLGGLHFGAVACRELVPDVWNLIGYLREELETLATAMPA